LRSYFLKKYIERIENKNNVIAMLLTMVAELVNNLTLPLSIIEKYIVIGRRMIAETFIK
tara:strand:+ start:376 stop:552 length:177 start_codon:yes stop_codon:yes gene_type:complete